MKKFLKFIAWMLVIIGVCKLILSCLSKEKDDDSFSYNREYIDLE